MLRNYTEKYLLRRNILSHANIFSQVFYDILQFFGFVLFLKKPGKNHKRKFPSSTESVPWKKSGSPETLYAFSRNDSELISLTV